MLDNNGEAQLNSPLETPGSDGTGDLWNPPETETSSGIEYLPG